MLLTFRYSVDTTENLYVLLIKRFPTSAIDRTRQIRPLCTARAVIQTAASLSLLGSFWLCIDYQVWHLITWFCIFACPHTTVDLQNNTLLFVVILRVSMEVRNCIQINEFRRQCIFVENRMNEHCATLNAVIFWENWSALMTAPGSLTFLVALRGWIVLYFIQFSVPRYRLDDVTARDHGAQSIVAVGHCCCRQRRGNQ